MREFFKPCRRKIGCVTLVMACVAMCGWVRGHIVEDSIEWGDAVLEKGKGERHMVSVSRNGLVWKQFETSRFNFVIEFREANKRWSCKPITTSSSADPLTQISFDCEFEWRWKGGGFDFGVFHEKWNQLVRVKYCTVPYWPIVVPITLLSIWLLLTKPVPSTPTKITEFTANESNF